MIVTIKSFEASLLCGSTYIELLNSDLATAGSGLEFLTLVCAEERRQKVKHQQSECTHAQMAPSGIDGGCQSDGTGLQLQLRKTMVGKESKTKSFSHAVNFSLKVFSSILRLIHLALK